MKKLIKKLRRIRVKFVRSNRSTKKSVLIMVTASMAALLVLNIAITAIANKLEENKRLAAQLEYENSQLEEKNENAGTVEGALDYAEDALGMVPTDAVVMQPTQ